MCAMTNFALSFALLSPHASICSKRIIQVASNSLRSSTAWFIHQTRLTAPQMEDFVAAGGTACAGEPSLELGGPLAVTGGTATLGASGSLGRKDLRMASANGGTPSWNLVHHSSWQGPR